MANCEVKAFVTNLGKYNEGTLQGEWVTFPIYDEEVEELFKRIGINDEYEEYFVTDYDLELPLFNDYGEYVSIETLNELAENLESLKDWELDILVSILEANGGSIQDALDNVGDYTLYYNVNGEEYEENIIEECWPEWNRAISDSWLSNYVTIDYERMFRDDENASEVELGVLVRC